PLVFSFLLSPPLLISTLFPYTTLFRSYARIRRLGPHLRPLDLWIDPSLRGLRGCVLLLPCDDRLRHPRTLLHRPAEEKGSLAGRDRKSTRLNSSHVSISYAVFCLKKKI